MLSSCSVVFVVLCFCIFALFQCRSCVFVQCCMFALQCCVLQCCSAVCAHAVCALLLCIAVCACARTCARTTCIFISQSSTDFYFKALLSSVYLIAVIIYMSNWTSLR